MGEILIKILIALYLSGNGHTVTLTAYSSDPAQTDSTPFEAAYGPVAECTIAISRDIKFRKRTFVFIPSDPGCLFFRKLMDTMNIRKENWGDLWCSTKKQALAYGIKRKKFVFIFN